MKWFAKQRLNVKFTLVIGFLVLIPILAIYFMLFVNMKKNTVEQLQGVMEDAMSQTYGEIQKTVDLCNMSTQVFLNNQSLNRFLVRLKKKEEIPTTEMVDFYQNDIAMLERMVNSNPYLYRIRVYARSNDFSEMMPILFWQKRMANLSWADSYISGQWQLDYADAAMGTESARAAKHLMSLVTSMEDYEMGEIGVMEVAVDMTRIFPQLFESDGMTWGCFYDREGKIYSGQEDEWWVENRRDMIRELMAEGPEDYCYLEEKIGGKNVILGCLPVKELGGYLIQAVSLEEELRELDTQRNIYMAFVAVVFVLMMFLINGIVNALLRGFHEIIENVRQVQEGDLDVRVSLVGSDEVGELGTQINKMLERIQILIEENVNRERLIKNSEIRALQNQINAHFIYNVLESIKMIAEVKEEYDISDAVTSLGRLLRYSMRWVSQDVTVRQEIEYIEDFLELSNLRFDYRINLSLKISDLVYEQKIPKMSLQPIVENAICHGIEELAEDASIYIKAVEYEDYYVLEITDSGKGMTEEEIRNLEKKMVGEMEVSGGSGNGIGLKNVQDRIRIAFGEPYGIAFASKVGCYTKVTVTMPFTRKGESETN